MSLSKPIETISVDHQKRIERICKHKPYMRQYFQYSPGNTYRIKNSRTGAPYLSLQIDANKTINLASKYDPAREASRIFPQDWDKLNQTDLVLLTGMGNPLVLTLLLAKLKANQICIIIEASFELVSLLCQKSTLLLDFLERPGCHLFAGTQSNTLFESYLESLPTERLSGVRILPHTVSRNLALDYYIDREETLRAYIKSSISDMLTRFRFESLWMQNIIHNSHYLPPKPTNTDSNNQTLAYAPQNLAAWHNTLQGIPGVLISAGPSLRNSLPLLHELKQKSFLIACDTALKVLLKAGIVPHAVFTLDAQLHTLFHFLGSSELKDVILFADIVCGPAILRHVQPKAVIFSTTARMVQNAAGQSSRQTTPGTEYAEKIHGPLGSLQSGGSVATSAFDLLRFLGCNKIILAGQDLAYTWRQIHSQGVHHYTKWQSLIHRTHTLESINESILSKRSTFLADGLDDKIVVGDYVLDIYRHWLADSSANIDLPVYNITNAGQKIEHTIRPRNIKKFIKDLPLQKNLINLFNKARPLKIYQHSQLKELIDQLGLIKNTTDIDKYWISAIEQFVFLKYIDRRVDVYIKRNAAKLSIARRDNLRNTRLLEAIEKLRRGLLKN